MVRKRNVEKMNYNEWCSIVSVCSKCDLSRTRKKVVIADGDPKNCKIMAIGEAPGKEEDERGGAICWSTREIFKTSIN